MPQRRRADLGPKRDAIREAIATRAFERFCARGGEHGHDLDDWLAAERELLTREAPAAAPSNERHANTSR